MKIDRYHGLDTLRAAAIILWSYAIYLTHKQIIHITQTMLSNSIIAKYNQSES